MSEPETLRINNVDYVRADSVETIPEGDYYIVVLDRGWVFHGRLEEIDGGYRLADASNIRKWSSVGFGGLTKDRAKARAVMDPCAPVTFSQAIFKVKVGDQWHR